MDNDHLNLLLLPVSDEANSEMYFGCTIYILKIFCSIINLMKQFLFLGLLVL